MVRWLQRGVLAAALALLMAGLVVSCDSGGTEPTPTTTMEVHLTSGLQFTPADLTIEPGTTVRWVNDASIFHTITPDGHSEWERATMTTAGDDFTHTFEAEGEFPYYCEPHLSQGMTGTVTVQAGP